MGQDVSNTGMTGIESIRIGGMTLQTLPMRESAVTQEQWPEVVANAKRQEVENILAQHPKQTIAYLSSRVTECAENIDRIRNLKKDQQKMIDEYSVHIGLCAHRDKEIAKLNPDVDKEAIKKLRLQFPPYDVRAMKQQINQCKEAIIHSDLVIDQEHDSIAELKDVISKCRLRDEALKPYGVEVG